MTAEAIIPTAVQDRVVELAAAADLPAYVFDLVGLDQHLARVRAALPPAVELYYAAKANSSAPVLATLAAHVDGIEVASGGELGHVRAVLPRQPIAFGGPGKTAAELAAAVSAGIHVLHVEGVHELYRLAAASERLDIDLGILLRLNPPRCCAGRRTGPDGTVSAWTS
jgi:diaminopimelate decarboxylase